MTPAPATRRCSCTDQHLCPTGQTLKRKATDLLAVVETAEDEEAQRESWVECRRAFSALRLHTGRRHW